MRDDLLTPERLARLTERLKTAATFEEASDAVLDALFEHVLESLGADPGRELLRGGVYLHGTRGLKGSLCRDARTRTSTEGRVPSQTALRLVAGLGAPVFIDVTRHVVAPARWVDDEGPRPDPFESQAIKVGERTAVLFSETDATHIYALPLRGASRPLGVVTLEWRCADEEGGPLSVWELVVEGAMQALEIAASRLGDLPFAEIRSDDLSLNWPVIGAAMRPVLRQLKSFAQGDGALLLLGPTGAGKTRLAAWAHGQSARHKGPFRTLHVQTYSDDSAGAYLFGWNRGAFTDARETYPGEVAQADGGTLFLDEIGLLSLRVQGQLLEFLQDHTYRRRGQLGEPCRADVRIIAATNEDLERAVAEGRFRLDLYLRLAGRPVEIPGLEERRDEIPRWAQLFVQGYHRQRTGRADADLSAEALAALAARDWPGSLHELKNAVECAYDLANDPRRSGPMRVELEHLRAPSVRPPRAGKTLGLDEAMKAAAVAWVDALERGGPLEALAWSEARVVFRSYLLLAAVERWGSPEGFRRLGEQRRVDGNNHSKELRSARDAVAAFLFRLQGRA